MNRQPDWLNKELYPFQSNWLELDGNNIHYLDEGTGQVVLFVHGTPEWSFGYRDLIKALRADHRCIAIDLLGFGLSDKPKNGDYRVEAHAARLQKFIEKLGLKNISLVANDFGGGISLPYALHSPDNVSHVVIFNTWMRSLKEDKHFSGPARVMNSWLGRFLYLQLNFPVKAIMPAAFGDKKKLTAEIHAHYKLALPDAPSRIAAYAFAKELMNASGWWQAHWDQLESLNRKPFLIFWGMKDTFIQPTELDKWKSKVPHAKVIKFDDAGHFVQEEKAREMAPVMREFFKTPKFQ